MITATIAIFLIGAQTASASVDSTLATYKLAGNEVAAKIPQTGLSLPSLKTVSWNGWNYYFNDAGKIVTRTLGKGGWSDIQSLYDASKAKIVDTTRIWRVKAVIFKRFDALETSKEGVIRQRRSTLETSQITHALESLARFASVADALCDGKLKVSLDVEIESEIMRFGPNRAKVAFDAAFNERYFGPRVNGGEFEAEDKVYRGPYDSVMYVHPGTPGDGELTTVVNRMPVTAVAFDPKDDGQPTRNLTVELLNAWVRQMARAATRYGCQLDPFARFAVDGNGAILTEGASLLGNPIWSVVSNRIDPSSAEYIDLFERNRKPVSVSWSDVSDDPLRKLPRLDIAFDKLVGDDTVSIVKRGQSTNVLVQADYASFVASHFKPEIDAKVIGWVQAPIESSHHGIVFFVFDAKGVNENASATDLLTLEQPPVAGGDSATTSLPTIPKWNWNSVTPVPIYDLPESIDPSSLEAKMLLAAKLTADSSDSEKADVIGMLSAREEVLKINAANAFTRVKNASVEPLLTEMIAHYNTRIDEMALKALAFQGSDADWATVKKAMDYGRYDYVRESAARLIATQNDPKVAGSVSTLISARSWQTRQAAAEVIGSFKDSKAAIILTTFITLEIDPAVRLSATKGAQVEYDLPARRLLWSSVNDESDQVRAWSYIGLIGAPQASYREEGYKGVRDESVSVRLMVLEYLRTHPNELNRGALRLAVADSDPEVRVAALSAFAEMPGEVSLDEIRNVLVEKDPRIQLALVELGITKKLKLSPETITALKSSLDPRVSERVKELPQ
jgi:HEAT repeat protein